MQGYNSLLYICKATKVMLDRHLQTKMLSILSRDVTRLWKVHDAAVKRLEGRFIKGACSKYRLVTKTSVITVKQNHGAHEKPILQIDMLDRVFFSGNFYYPLFAMELLML